MSLVAYADSDCDSDDDNGEVILPSPDVVKVATKTIGSKPFLTLPEPKSIENIKTIDDYDSVDKEKPVVQTKLPIVNNIQEKKEIPLFPTLPKPKTGGKVKIIIPSLNEVIYFVLKFEHTTKRLHSQSFCYRIVICFKFKLNNKPPL